ncbi:hypothetical protein U0070_000736 [Myodes glareolus]|uniref:Secreted protein n=1 Tax=Myodes glareolus TaxID=447135 RepID=A0AAW0J6L9_MYOGA
MHVLQSLSPLIPYSVFACLAMLLLGMLRDSCWTRTALIFLQSWPAMSGARHWAFEFQRSCLMLSDPKKIPYTFNSFFHKIRLIIHQYRGETEGTFKRPLAGSPTSLTSEDMDNGGGTLMEIYNSAHT